MPIGKNSLKRVTGVKAEAPKEEKIIHAKQIENNTASFYLSSDFTQELLKDGESESYYEYCIRANYASRGRHTPIHRKTLTVKRC